MAYFLRACSLAKNSASVETHVFLRITPSSSRGTSFRGRLPVRAHACDATSLVVDHHATLGVSSGASRLEIKRAYRRLARQFHPDVCKDSCSEQWFKHINQAYESLMRTRPAATSGSTVVSEAGYESLEELLRWSEVGGEESSWAIAEEVCGSKVIDLQWLEVANEYQESVDVSVFTTPSDEGTDLELAWLRW